MTTYEGASLQQLADTNQGLSIESKEAAKLALGALHAAGVLHGDVELHNAVWRNNDCKVLWVDLEFAKLRRDVVEFEVNAKSEQVRRLRLLDLVPTIEVLRLSPAVYWSKEVENYVGLLKRTSGQAP